MAHPRPGTDRLGRGGKYGRSEGYCHRPPPWHDANNGSSGTMASIGRPQGPARGATRLVIAAMLIFCAMPGARAQVCSDPGLMQFDVTSKIVRSRVGFTQGLELRDGVLYESTGNVGGTTQLNTITLDGKVTNLSDQGRKVFGEGLTILNDEVVQLTWQDRQVFVYDLAGKLKRQMRNPRDGWGLAHDGTNLMFTDGGPSLYYADPKTFKLGKSVTIRAGKNQVAGVNELERVDGKLYGNIFTTRSIVRFDPETGGTGQHRLQRERAQRHRP
jgi:glutamine cyclotransferase